MTWLPPVSCREVPKSLMGAEAAPMALSVPPETPMGPATVPGWLVTVVPGLIVSVTPAGTVTPAEGSVTVPGPQQLLAAATAPLTGPVSPPAHAMVAAGDAK